MLRCKEHANSATCGDDGHPVVIFFVDQVTVSENLARQANKYVRFAVWKCGCSLTMLWED